MPTVSSKRKGQKQISYQEVDSDYDMDSEEEEKVVEMKGKGGVGDDLEDKKKVGDTYGTTPHAKKQKTRKATKKKNNNKLTYDVQLLLNLPFDLFAETCTRLEGSDLLSLAMVNKSLRKILLSRHSRSIWIASRKRDGFPLPQGMSEIALCRFMNEDSCQVCGKTQYFGRICELRVRLCNDHRKTHCIREDKLSSQWRDLHPSAKDCVRFLDNGTRYNGRAMPRTYLVPDLAAVDIALKELEEEDELALARIESTFQKSNTRRRLRQVSSNPPLEHADAVSLFVAKKEGWVLSENEMSAKLGTARRARNMRKWKDEDDARNAKRHKIKIEASALQNNHGWTKDEAAKFEQDSYSAKELPCKSIDEDPAAWAVYHNSIQREVRKQAAQSAKETAQRDRETRIQPLYDRLKLSPDPSWHNIFPKFPEFVRLSHVKPLCEANDDLVDESALQKAITRATPAVRRDLQAYFDSVKFEAIRHILAANQNVRVSTISNNTEDYDMSSFDDDFFCRVTSLFLQYDWSSPGRRVVAAPFSLITTSGTWYAWSRIHHFIDARQIQAIRSMVDAAGLDAEDTFILDMDDLGKGFCWTNNPSKTRRKTKYEWFQLLDLVVRRGPSNAQVLAGNGVEISYSPPVDSDVDDTGEEGGEEEETEEDEEDEEA